MIVLVFVVQYLAKQIPNITKEIMSTFSTKQENSASTDMGNNAWTLTTVVAGQAKNLAKIIMNPEKKENKETKK